MQTLLQDVRYALRQLRKAPGFATTAILTLALGIGATTSIFTLVYQVMLRSIPVSHPEQLYKVGKEINCCVSGGLQDDWSLFSYDFYQYLRDQTPGTAGMAAVQAGATTASVRRATDASAQSLDMHFVSGNYFSVLGVLPYAGRLITPEDDREGAPAVVVMTYTLWQTKFGADPKLLGSTVMLTGRPATVIGITAQNFYGERNVADAAAMWMPINQEPAFEPDRRLAKFPNSHWLDLLVRVSDPHQVNHVQVAIKGEMTQWIRAHSAQFPGASEKDLARPTTELMRANDGINELRDNYESSLKLLMLVAGFVLLIACANLANLMMVRGMARQQELAVRSALGAPRVRLVAQMLVEAILLSLIGGLAALGVAYAGTRAILALAMAGAQVSPLSASPSLPVLAFALAISLVTGVLFGIAPAWITSRSNPVEALRGANRSTRDTSARPQKVLVILQAALSLALLSTAGLLITSLHNLEHQNFRLDTQGRLILFVDLPASGLKPSQLPGLYQRMDDSFTHLPGIESFAYATYAPMAFNNWSTGVFFPGVAPDSIPQNDSSFTSISPQFFQTVGTHILLGRSVSEHDTQASTHVAVVNQTFVNRFLKGKFPVGQHFGTDRKMTTEFEIVGVVEDTRYGDPASTQNAMFFTPITQTTNFTDERDISGETFKHYAGNLVFHYHGDPASAASSVRQTLKSINPDIAILRMLTYDDQISRYFTQNVLVVRLTTLFGLLALILAAIGLYGVTAYAVARRSSEIGIRMALGASRESVLSMIVRSALGQAAVGLLIGLPLAYGAGRFVQHSLYNTSAFQPLVLLAVVVLLLAAALAAAIIPARRAASIDPMKALRTE